MQRSCWWGGRESEVWGGGLDYGSTSALAHWPYLLNALRKTALACTWGMVQCTSLDVQYMSVYARVQMRVCVCVPCELSLFHASHTGLRNMSSYYREEHAQCYHVLVHIPDFLAP